MKVEQGDSAVSKYSNIGLYAAAEMAKVQQEMEERLSAKLKVASAREELLSGFLAMKPMDDATRRQVELFLRVMTLSEEAGQIQMKGGSEPAGRLLVLMDEAEELLVEFRRLDQE
jgi:hypothetical protein